MELVGIVGFSVAAFAYLIFLLLLSVIREKSFVAKMIVGCSAVTFVGVVLAAVQIYFGVSLKVVLLAENIKLFGFLLLLMTTQYRVTSFEQLLHSTEVIKYLVIICCVSGVCWLISFFGDFGGKYLFFLFLILNLWLIVQLEQLYRNAEAKLKWALWPLIISLGMVSVFDFVIYAQATMLDQLDFNYWFARGYVIALSMPFFLISARRIKNWHVDVFVSRDVVFYGSMLMIAGGYLLVLSFAGYIIKFVGGQWGELLSIIFVVLGLGVLATLLMTEKLRREVKVFITKHFYANKYDYRIEWLNSIEQLAVSDSENFYKTATEIICASMNTDKGSLLKRLPDGSYKVAYSNNLLLDKNQLEQVKVADNFCQQHGWIIDIREYQFVEDSYPNLMLDVEFCLQANIDLIVPVMADKPNDKSAGKSIYGLFILSLENKKTILNWEDRDLLFAMSKQLSNFISLNEANIELAESKQFEAFHRMSAFLVHDLKNVQAQLALINSNAEKHRDKPAFIDDVFETVESATERLDKVLTQLRNKQPTELIKRQKPLHDILMQVVAQRNINKPSVALEIDGQLTINVNEELVSVLNHLVQNAQEATADDGWVKIKVSQESNILYLAVIDNGSGMSELFIKNRLFKPFDTTKGNAGMGIGVYEAKQFIESLGGSISVTSFENEGSIFKLAMPIDHN